MLSSLLFSIVAAALFLYTTSIMTPIVTHLIVNLGTLGLLRGTDFEPSTRDVPPILI
jgi:membrane protease YdiL (CAAX protease family)